ncbi:replicase, partial [Klebsiella pneumoniae]|nr:replicase [Klebsiella pneumoniae]
MNVLKTGFPAAPATLHGHWKIAVWQPELYTLDWLADSLDLSAANDKEIVADYGLGRN